MVFLPTSNACIIVAIGIAMCDIVIVDGFSNLYNNNNNVQKTLSTSSSSSSSSSSSLFMSSFSSDGSEYSAKDSDYDSDNDEMSWGNDAGDMQNRYRDEQDDVPTTELKPVPMSKNTGNRFVALYWDHELEQNKVNKNEENPPRESWWLHYDRDDLNEDHVMFCRKRNLYNETFNSDSMVDILRSLPM
jgi:hypothetical protein